MDQFLVPTLQLSYPRVVDRIGVSIYVVSLLCKMTKKPPSGAITVQAKIQRGARPSVVCFPNLNIVEHVLVLGGVTGTIAQLNCSARY